jgi:predicted MFS family arabinose efflux permease
MVAWDDTAREERTIMQQKRVELVLGWLAILLASGVVAYTNFVENGFSVRNIAPDTLHWALLGFGVLMLGLALGVTLDGVFDLLPGRVLLVISTLIFAVITALLFDYGFFFWPSLFLAGAASVLAISRRQRVGRRA